MKKCFWLGVVFFLVIAAVFDAQVVLAGVDPLASPTPQPTKRIAAPVIIGINPVVQLSEGNQGDTHPSDNLLPPSGPGMMAFIFRSLSIWRRIWVLVRAGRATSWMCLSGARGREA